MLFVGIMHQSGVGQVTLSFLRFLGQDVAFVRMLSLDFSATGNCEALFCARNRLLLLFRHFLVTNNLYYEVCGYTELRGKPSPGQSLRACLVPSGAAQSASFGLFFGIILFCTLLFALFCCFLGCEHHIHTFAFEGGHAFHFGNIFQIGGKTEQKHFALILKENAASSKENVCFDLSPIREKLLSVLEFEAIVVVIGLRSEADFLNDHFGSISLLFFLTLALLINELLVIYYSAYRWVGSGNDLNEIQSGIFSHLECLPQGKDTGFHIVAYYANFPCRYLLVDAVLLGLFSVLH